MISELEVWLFADRIGTLSLDRGALGFSYLDSWLQRKDSVALSISLPLQSQPFTDVQARPFFSGLLPEGRVRQLLSKQLQISTQNDFVLLDYIGGECAGAITLLQSSGVAPAPLPTDFSDVQWLTGTQLDSILDELPRRPMMAGGGEYRLSLAGTQDKLPVVFDGIKIGLPANGRPSTHIMKPAISEVQGSVVNEGFCMALAAMTGIPTAATMIRRVKDKEYLLVERYDRISESDQPFKLHRLHQEDFCQALALVPEMKYQNEGGPDFEQCFALLRQVTRPSAPQILSMVDLVFFNTLIGNNDAHSKNYSLLYTGNKIVLAPAYDVLSTCIYLEFSKKMAMKIGSQYEFNLLHARHWDQFADATGLAKAQTKKRLLQMAKKLPDTARQLQAKEDTAFAGQDVVDQIIALIVSRCRQTIRRLEMV